MTIHPQKLKSYKVVFKRLLKMTVYTLVCLLYVGEISAQEIPNQVIEQQLETISEADDSDTEDDSYQQQLQQLRRNPLNLNKCSESDLQVFRWLSDLQIKNLLVYRQLLGFFVSIYELQSVPGWDIESISKTRPFITVSNSTSTLEDLKTRLIKGDHNLLLRLGQVFEKSIGFLPVNDTIQPKYSGNPQRLYIRYKYQYKNLLQFGILGDKDAGEQFFKGAQKKGFDFYSMHLFARDLGIIRKIAVGDFTVNLAQGLLTYQSLAFRKSVDVVNIKRQTEIFRPYNSAGEYNFHRGAAITLGSNSFQFSAFASFKKVDANAVIDTTGNEANVSSILTSGYHRTGSEIADRKNIQQLAAGGRLQYRHGKWQVGINSVHYQLSKPLQKQEEPYNNYAFGGDKLTGFSTDYAYTFRNLHVFGEVASDQKLSIAQVHGLVASVHSRVDMSVLYRNIARDYNSINANAFTENTTPINERGLYAGLSVRPWGMLRIDMYADVYRFPWLKYRVSRPSDGSDYLLQLTWRPNKQVEVYTRFKSEKKAINYPASGLPFYETEDVPRQNWRTHVSYKISSAVTIRSRVEVMWYDQHGKALEQGFLLYGDVFYKPMMRPFSMNMRFQFFDTDGYNSRLYAYENDVLYSYSIPPFSGSGFRWYCNVNYDINKHLSVWLRLARTVLQDAKTIGSGYDVINGNHKTDYKTQLLFSF
jgi:DNA uptake protein ComE-like DNA-binding protein